VSIASGFSLLGDQALYAVLPVMHESLGLSAIQVGILLSINRWIRLLTNDWAHRAAQMYAASLLLPTALAVGAATTALYAVTSSFTVLLIARLLWGLAWSFIRHTGVGAVMQNVPAGATGRAMGFYNGVSRAGSAAGLFGGAVLIDGVGFRAGVLILAGISLLAVPLALRAFTGPLPHGEPHREHTGAAAPIALLLLGGCIGVVPAFVLSTLGASISTYTEVSALIPAATLTGAVLATRYVLDSLAAPVLGFVFDRLGLHRSTIACLAGGMLLLITASARPDLAPFVACIVLFFAMTTLMHAGVGGAASACGSGIYAKYVTALDFGAAAGPLLAWVLVAQFDDPFIPLAAAGVVSGVTLVAVWRHLGDL
jgi:predicted MFS family arabinose efflux permease